MCFFAFFGMPIPLSFNERMALRFVAFKSRLISPWGMEYLQALERRLSSNISIRCLSAETKTDSSGWVRFSVNCFFSQKDRKTETSFSKTSFRQSGTDEETYFVFVVFLLELVALIAQDEIENEAYYK